MKFSPETENLIPRIGHPCPECKYTNMRECIEECKLTPVIPDCPSCGREFHRLTMYAYVPLRMFSATSVVMAMAATMSPATLRVHHEDDTVYYNIPTGGNIPKMLLYCSNCFYCYGRGDSSVVDTAFFARWNEEKLPKNSAIRPRLADIRGRAVLNGLIV